MAASKLSIAQVEKAVQAVDGGKSVREVAKEFGVQPSAVRYHLHARGCGRRTGELHRRLTREQVAQMLSIYQNEIISLKELGLRFGITAMAARYHLRQNNIKILKSSQRRRRQTACKICGQTAEQTAFYRRTDNLCKQCSKIHATARNHRITEEQVLSIFDKSGWRCQICGQIERKLLCLDHDHRTGRIRGVLCQQCNALLGRFQDDPTVIQKAINYLDRGCLALPETVGVPKGRLGRLYGLTTDQAQKLRVLHQVCQICGQSPEPTVKFPDLVIDHRHDTGEVRGLLCWRCNFGLGCARDDIPTLKRAISYLQKLHSPVVSRFSKGGLGVLHGRSDRPYEAVYLDPEEWNVDRLMVDRRISHSEATKQVLRLQLEHPNRLMVLWSDEQSAKVDRMLAHKNGQLKVDRLAARKCQLREVGSDEARDFYDQHHLQGSPSYLRRSYGLDDPDGQLVALMSFGLPQVCRSNHQGWLLQRFACSRPVVGSASRLFTAFRRQLPGTPLISYSDHRYAGGQLYEQLGFMSFQSYGPDYRYYRDGSWWNKSRKQKKQLLTELEQNGRPADSDLTEFEMARQLGYLRCYDCGRTGWSFNLG